MTLHVCLIAEVAEEVIEKDIAPESSTTTGDKVANPSHTEKLDAAGT